MTIPFTKPALSFADQIRLLQSRGMAFADTAAAERFLSQVNYYRLTAYWLPFEATHDPHAFRPGTSFETIVSIYNADRELRLLLFDAIERIEVAVRTQWAHCMAVHHGPHGYLQMDLALDPHIWRKDMNRLISEVYRSKEVFIRHLTKTYAEMLPPVWAVCEVMSFGLLSSWCGNLKPSATLDAIAKPFGVQRDVFVSWIHHLSLVRNICAHHSRLWNRSFTVIPKVPTSKPVSLQGQFITDPMESRKLYNTLLLITHLMHLTAPQSSWRARLLALVQGGTLDPSAMGFPKGWETLAIWKVGA